MKAAVITEFKAPIEVKQVPIPEITHSQVLVKMLYTGMCGTDHHVWKGELGNDLPRIPGHEGVGEVVEVGADVEHVKKGDIVGIPWLHDACGNCEYCFSGWETLCERQHNAGFTCDGTMAEYAVADPKYVARIPEGVDLARIAPILCAGVTTYKGLKVTETRAEEWVMITGLGGLGQLAVQYAIAMGMKVIGVDIDDEKLEAAKKYGASYAFNGKTQDVAKLAKEVTNGGVQGILVTAVNRSAFGQALGALRRNGTMVLIGLAPGDFPLNIVNTVIDGLTIRGSIVGTRYDMMECLEFFKDGKIHNEVEIEKLDDAWSLMQKMDKGQLPGRVVYDFSK